MKTLTIDVQFDIGDEVYYGYFNSNGIVIHKDIIEEIYVSQDRSVNYRLGLNGTVSAYRVFSNIKELEGYFIKKVQLEVEKYSELVRKSELKTEKQKEG